MDAEGKQRVIVHLDVDAFYVAAERELRPDLRNRPCAVSQYNPYGDLSDCSIEDPARVLYDGEKPTEKRHPNANGSLIAVSYEARARDVKRNDRGLEAIRKCPEIAIIQVPVLHGKASLSIYRDASERLMSALANGMNESAVELYRELNSDPQNSFRLSVKSIPLEKASVDEVYLDISVPVRKILRLCVEKNCWEELYRVLIREESASTHTTIGGLESRQAAIATNSLSKDDIRRGSSLQVLDSDGAAKDTEGAAWWSREFPTAWSDEEISLGIGALITLKARKAIVKRFDGNYTLSAGVSINKTMAKLASGLKKPNRQTLVNPLDETTLEKLFHPLPLGRIRGLGGKLGDQISEKLQIKTVGDLKKIPLAKLRDEFGQKQGQFLFRIAQGICDEEVTERTKPKCIGAGKTFQGKLSICSSDQEKLKKWLGNLVSDIIDRIAGDKTRYAKNLVCWLNMMPPGGDKAGRRKASQSAALPRNASAEKFTNIALKLANDILKNAGATNDANGDGSLLIVGMSVTATNFVSIAQGSSSILEAFQRSTNGEAGLKSPRGLGTRQLSQRSKPAKGLDAYLKPPLSEINNSSTNIVDAGSPTINLPSKRSLLDTETLAEGEVVDGDGKSNLAANAHDDSQLSSDLEHARALQKQYDKEASMGASRGTSNVVEEARTSNLATASPVLVEDDDAKDPDPDLEYAKQLQASFDRENEVISTMEKRQSISRGSGSNKVKRQGKRRKQAGGGSRPISNFFGRK